MNRAHARTLATAAGLLACAATVALAPPETPAQRYGDLYARVENEHLFEDSKTFADAEATSSPDAILAAYRDQKPATPEALRSFVAGHFDLPKTAATPAVPAAAKRSLREHIAALWPMLTRPATPHSAQSSQLGFSRAHVVPGGRFREVYYWDSYFTLLGMTRDGHASMATDMVDGFADLIRDYGHIPNGTRSYYLSRSQPPFFFLMAGLTSPADPVAGQARVLTALKAEYAFWMAGEQDVKPGEAAQHVVRLADGAVLNRYWDRLDTPRDESFREDVSLAQPAGRPAPVMYRELRSAAESGWDFSSRWFADGRTLATIETTSIVPVDLNALLYGLERAIEQACSRAKDAGCTKEFGSRARDRRAAMDRVLWNAACGCWSDWQWVKREPTLRLSAATLYPLFTGVASKEQAAAVAKTVRARLLAEGGLETTTERTGQQWDRPNGWAPLQWIAVSGLRDYGEAKLAEDIARRWLATVQYSFDASGKLVEKYDLETRSPGGGGEYPLQDGFGWTNGVTRALLDLYPATKDSAQ